MKKKQVILILRITALAVGLICTIVFPPWRLVWAWMQPLPDTVREEVDNAIDHRFDGIIVYVDEAGKPPAFYSAGWHDRKNKIPADPHALFKIASINKLYVAVTVAKLVNDKRLSLDKTLADYLPDLAGRIENAEKITLKLMVQHRSGIPNLTDIPDYWVDPPKGRKAKIEMIFDFPANFEPDKDYEYSNTNYLLLAEIIDRELGYSHQRFIRERILDRLGLSHTFGSIHDVDIDEVMGGYYVGIEADIKTDDNGSMLAAAEDVGIFLRALNDGSLFDEGEQEIYSSIYVYEHTGLMPGYQSIAKYHKDIDTVVIQFVNTTDFSDYTNWALSELVYNRIVKILRKQKGS